MPTYTYECKDHGIFDRFYSLKENSDFSSCTICKKKCKKIIISCSFKGFSNPNQDQELIDSVTYATKGFQSKTHQEVEMERRLKRAEQTGVPKEIALNAKSPFEKGGNPTPSDILNHKTVAEKLVTAHREKKPDDVRKYNKALKSIEAKVSKK